MAGRETPGWETTMGDIISDNELRFWSFLIHHRSVYSVRMMIDAVSHTRLAAIFIRLVPLRSAISITK